VTSRSWVLLGQSTKNQLLESTGHFNYRLLSLVVVKDSYGQK
jgi:hypothetical protein